MAPSPISDPLRHTAGMEQLPIDTPRVATVTEVASVAGLLHAFNREYDTPTPGKAVLAARLGWLFAGGDVVALLTGDPAVAVASHLRGRGLGSALLAAAEAVTGPRGRELLEINVDGDDTGARRFYERHGYVNSEPGEDQPLFYYYRKLGNATSWRERHRDFRWPIGDRSPFRLRDGSRPRRRLSQWQSVAAEPRQTAQIGAPRRAAAYRPLNFSPRADTEARPLERMSVSGRLRNQV
jgi:GNAT superfamily N-acetyltransferase